MHKLIKNRHILGLSSQTPQLFAALLPHLDRFPKHPHRLLNKLQNGHTHNGLPLNLQHQFMNDWKTTLNQGNFLSNLTIPLTLVFERMEVGLEVVEVLVDGIQEIHTEVQFDAVGLFLLQLGDQVQAVAEEQLAGGQKGVEFGE